MSRNLLGSALFVALLCLCWPVAAQPSDPAPAEEPVPGTAESSQDPSGASGEGELDGIDQILEEDDEVFAGGGQSYDPGDRRDPFKSPLRRDRVALPRGPRPDGKAGLLIDELALTGIFSTPQGTFAQVRGGRKKKSYLLQAGDQLYDGDVVKVEDGEVTFNQLINDPAAIKPFREVVKRLRKKAQ